MNELAINGGNKIKTTPFGTGRRFGFEEGKELLEALEQNTLFYHAGNKVKTFLNNFNELYGVKYSVAASSGTAAIHVALGVSGVTVGDEVITSPITDQGTLIGILYQNAIPVFADLDPNSYNLSPESVEEKITDRTKAIVVVHLAGNPVDMDPIMEIATKYRLKVIEDCAQSYMAKYEGKLVGTIGDYGCFSTNDFKHISTGDGGMVTINSNDEDDFKTAHAFADKNYQRFGTNVQRELNYLAPNYRMTELQGAVGIAQLKKLPFICEKRTKHGDEISMGIKDLKGIYSHKVNKNDTCTYWFYMFRIDEESFSCSRNEFAEALRAEGIPASAGYIPQVVYLNGLFQNKQAYINSHFPFELSSTVYKKGLCPEAEKILLTSIRIPVSEFYTDDDIRDIVNAIHKVTSYYQINKVKAN
ncbi:DegT/DnrJ/EryC1/StrS family aminotransferase [Pseudalkalibacillus decolorationis]|uniref:DegT/DnrJ/EryC1/StrS family aminotransferase n=1 Tax=Pseudalkalibacillus decolorationis TaxID=163879 RepID=UPI00214749DE|nr:DegT/DnrJ/EryC1/StrS family aminotransferase [Pseudalkalibacillus decolorationis]